MKKPLENSFDSLENSIDEDFSIKKFPIFLNKQFHDYDEENKDEDDFSYADIKNSYKDNKNESNKNIIFEEPVTEHNIPNETIGNIIDNNIKNKKLEKEKVKQQNLEDNCNKKFQLFNKGTSSFHEIINSINNKKQKPKKLFKIYNYENGDKIKLVGRKRKSKPKKRGEKSDDIRKKLKSRFHKIFTKKINANLKAINSEKEFYLMPQVFITNIAKKQNKEVMNLKIKDLFRKNFIEDYKKYKTNSANANKDKYLKNLNTLNYLENNIDIKEKCKFNIIGEMRYFEILDEFFYSKEFEDTVIAESKKKPVEYVKDYVNKARTYVKFFLFSK